MQVKINETRTHKVENETINGINISALLESAAVNNDVPDTGYMTTVGFDPSNVNIEVTLLRKGSNYPLLNSNLALIAHYQTIKRNGFLWRKGVNLQAKSAGTTHMVTRPLFIDLGGHINVSGSDILSVTVTVNRGAFGTGIDASNSTLQIEVNQSIGVEHALYRFNTYAIQASQNSDLVNLGDNVTKIALVSFEKDWTKPIFRSASLSSDRLDWTSNEQELILRHFEKFGDLISDNLLSATATNANPLYYPHTRLLHEVEEIDRAKLQFTMTSPNVLASQNFVCWTSFETSMDILEKAAAMQNKHNQKNLDKVPLSI